jgi:hypothetical protein
MPTTTELKKVVREVLDEEFGDANEATLKAVQRLHKLVTEQVIPKLPDEHDEEEPGTGHEEAPAALRSAARRRHPDPRPSSLFLRSPKIPKFPKRTTYLTTSRTLS